MKDNAGEIDDKELLPGEKLVIEAGEAFAPICQEKRFKGLRGGRGSAKSHFVAETFVEDAVNAHHRFACMREFQSSIAESSKRLIEDKIRKFGLGASFKVTDKEIVGPNDSLFIFKGLHGHTAESIKSLEGFTRLWVEESQTVSQNSLDLVVPTFRQQIGLALPQLYFTWNPSKPDDPIDKMFEENAGDPDFVCITVNFRDNPWFPEDLRRDMLRDKRRNKDKYQHIWLGGFKKRSEAIVFDNWQVEAFETPKGVRFFFGADWGFSKDPTVLIRMYIDPNKKRLFIDHEAYKIGCKIQDTPALFDTVPESKKWPIRADSARPETIEYMKDHGFPRMEAAQKGPNSVEDGIEFLKDYDIIIHPRCVHTADEFAFYSYKVDKKTNAVLPELNDKDNHVIDAARYGVESIRKGKTVIVTDEFVNALQSQLRQRPANVTRKFIPRRR